MLRDQHRALRVAETTTPSPLAEHLDPQIAESAVRHYETRATGSGLLHSAWAHAEYAMNAECLPEVGVRYLETTDFVLGELIKNGDLVRRKEMQVREDTKLGALVLASYLPVLRARSAGELPSSDDCRMIYQSIGGALRHMQPLRIDEPPQWRMVESAVLALSGRIGRPELLLYPASPREEESGVDSINHDSYFYLSGRKLPIQQKLLPVEHEYDDIVTVMTVEPLLTKGMIASKYPGATDLTLADKVNALLSCIVAETSNQQLDISEKRLLNFMTQAIAAHHEEIRTIERLQRVA